MSDGREMFLGLNRARELQHKVSVFREFQTAGAEQYLSVHIAIRFDAGVLWKFTSSAYAFRSKQR